MFIYYWTQLQWEQLSDKCKKEIAPLPIAKYMCAWKEFAVVKSAHVSIKESW